MPHNQSRVIKFRAWDKEDNRMSYSSASRTERVGMNYPWGFQTGNHDIEIMQFTGLLDKNGKEIYEGDIVKYKSCVGEEETTAVEWATYGSGFEPFTVCEKCGDTPDQNEVEIIGNIYENPELLK